MSSNKPTALDPLRRSSGGGKFYATAGSPCRDGPAGPIAAGRCLSIREAPPLGGQVERISPLDRVVSMGHKAFSVTREAWRLRLLGVVDAIRERMRSREPLDARWRTAGLVSPFIEHGADRSEISFVLSSVNDEALQALYEAKRNKTPVRLRSLRRPLLLLITDLERIKSGLRIAGRIGGQTKPPTAELDSH